MAYKYRISPTKKQASQIIQACGCRRFVYNWALEIKQTSYLSGEKLNFLQIQAMLPALKEENPWLRDSNSQSLQATLRDLDGAYVRFFKKQAELPTFKKRGKSKESFLVPQHFKVEPKNGIIVIPKIGNVKVIFDRNPEGTPKSITISMSKSGKFFASILCEQDIDDPIPKPVDPKTTIGIDVGLKSFAVISDGRVIRPLSDLRKSRKHIEYLHRQLSRKQKGSSNRNKARIRLARAYEKRTNQQNDFIHKLTHQLTSDKSHVGKIGTICIESLNITGMVKNHHLARSISEVSWGEFYRQLDYKCRWNGVNLIRIGRFEPSSRLCPCGYRNDGLTLADREWVCPKCNTTHDRDLLAANNIRMMGLSSLTESRMAAGTVVTKPEEPPVRNRGQRIRKPARL